MPSVPACVDATGAVVDGKPDWCKKLDKAKEAIDNVFLIENGIEYRIGKKIGEGSFGVIFDGKRLSEGKSAPVAFKFVRVRSIGELPHLEPNESSH